MTATGLMNACLMLAMLACAGLFVAAIMPERRDGRHRIRQQKTIISSLSCAGQARVQSVRAVAVSAEMAASTDRVTTSKGSTT